VCGEEIDGTIGDRQFSGARRSQKWRQRALRAAKNRRKRCRRKGFCTGPRWKLGAAVVRMHYYCQLTDLWRTSVARKKLVVWNVQRAPRTPVSTLHTRLSGPRARQSPDRAWPRGNRLRWRALSQVVAAAITEKWSRLRIATAAGISRLCTPRSSARRRRRMPGSGHISRVALHCLWNHPRLRMSRTPLFTLKNSRSHLFILSTVKRLLVSAQYGLVIPYIDWQEVCQMHCREEEELHVKTVAISVRMQFQCQTLACYNNPVTITRCSAAAAILLLYPISKDIKFC